MNSRRHSGEGRNPASLTPLDPGFRRGDVKGLIAGALWMLLAFPLAAVESSLPTETTACQDVNTSSGCPPMIPQDPEWKKELEKVQKDGEACQPDIEKFCEGVQVGQGRIEACLKANRKKLSKDCRKAQGFTK